MSNLEGWTTGESVGPMLEVAYRTLLVDDEPAFLSVAAALLGSHPRVVVVGQATSGAAALTLLPGLAPNAMLLDVQMPEMHGFAAARALRARAPTLSIVLTSVLDDEAYAAAAGRLGAAFLPKRRLSAAAFVELLDGLNRS